MRKILVAIGSRANYASLKSAMVAIHARTDLQLVTVAYSTAVLERYGNVANQMEQDGFPPEYRFSTHIEGENLASMAKSAGNVITEFATLFEIERPDFVLVVGDRYEVLPAVFSAAAMNIPVAHTMGGEVTGTIDESIRHSISKLSHLHFPATALSRERLLMMGEDPRFVFAVGCPRIDLAKQVVYSEEKVSNLELDGVGASIDLGRDFIMVSQHPVTTEYELAPEQMKATLEAVRDAELPAIVLWPNSDAGSADMSRVIRRWREENPTLPFRFVKNLPPETYLYLMSRTVCLVGNSSSGLREGSFLGTPVVDVGTRQSDRERAENVLFAPNETESILEAIRHWTTNRHSLNPSRIYGDGTAGTQIAEILATTPMPSLQKRFFDSFVV